jgi:response regulator RpfG family c-di-GMP phosphodiesterase
VKSSRVLCVDDEPNVLHALVRTLSEDFDVDIADGGEAALAKMATNSYAVVLSDMRMPKMNGATLLARVRETKPLTVRILLTGQTDMEAAMAAVNDGAVFRFLAKPCPPSVLVKTMHAAVEQHRLLSAERELLDGTVQGIVRLLADVLAAASPAVSARAGRLRGMVAHVAESLRVPERWQYEVAALLSPLGCISLPDDLVTRALAAQPLDANDQRAFEAHAETGFRLLEKIPRFDKVAEIVRAQITGTPAEATDASIVLGASILRVVVELDERHTRGASHDEAIGAMKGRPRDFDSKIVGALETYRATERWSTQSLVVDQMGVGMICEEDIVASTGSVIVRKGSELVSVTLERLRRFAEGAGVREPVRMRVKG